jgi:hypothetical protein
VSISASIIGPAQLDQALKMAVVNSQTDVITFFVACGVPLTILLRGIVADYVEQNERTNMETVEEEGREILLQDVDSEDMENWGDEDQHNHQNERERRQERLRERLQERLYAAMESAVEETDADYTDSGSNRGGRGGGSDASDDESDGGPHQMSMSITPRGSESRLGAGGGGGGGGGADDNADNFPASMTLSTTSSAAVSLLFTPDTLLVPTTIVRSTLPSQALHDNHDNITPTNDPAPLFIRQQVSRSQLNAPTTSMTLSNTSSLVSSDQAVSWVLRKLGVEAVNGINNGLLLSQSTTYLERLRGADTQLVDSILPIVAQYAVPSIEDIICICLQQQGLSASAASIATAPIL